MNKQLPHWLGNFNDGLNLPDKVAIPEEADILHEKHDAATNGRSCSLPCLIPHCSFLPVLSVLFLLYSSKIES